MQAYIDYLLEDMANAHRKEVPISEKIKYPTEEEAIRAHFEEVERWLASGEPTNTFGYYCGLQSEQFPPAEKLSKAHMKTVIAAFKELLTSWNLDVYCPKEIPLSMAYSLIVGIIDTKTEIVNEGTITIEFCDYNTELCGLGKYCYCTDEGNDMEIKDFNPF